MEQLKLRDVVIGDRGEVLVESHLQQLKGVDHFLGPIDQLQDIAKSLSLSQSLQALVERVESGAQRALRLSDTGGRRLKISLDLSDFRCDVVLNVEQFGDFP